jgi:adenosylcobinamide-GDP ribazoletransferase
MRPGSPLLADFYSCLGFFTRLPLPPAAARSEPHSLANFSRAVRMLPVAGGLI